MPSWAIVSTIKAPEEKMLAFVAHHLSLGAARIFLYFDDPDDPGFAAATRLDRVTATRCTETYWTERGGRHDRHQNRQSRNARDAYARCSTDWLGHIDVDEFILSPRPVGEVLSDIPVGTDAVKLEPFEAMHDPLLPDDIYTAHEFRGAIRHEHWPLRRGALGKYREFNRDGLLSHSNGKVIFRTGIKGLSPRLHSVMLKGVRLPTPDWHPEMKLLHFHAQDRQAWRTALPFRLTRGAYMYRPGLQAFLAGATPEEIDTFYLQTQVMSPDSIAELQAIGRVIIADLSLRQKVRALQDGAFENR
jgi:Glycosyl transferase family 2